MLKRHLSKKPARASWREVILVALCTLLVISTLTFVWEFFLEYPTQKFLGLGELSESDAERLNYVFSSLVFAALAMIAPVLLSVSYIRKQNIALDEAFAAKGEAERAASAKSAFLANMSHELRTPLNAILGFSEVIANGMASNNPDKCQEYAQNIFASGEHLLSLVQDLLDLSRIESGRVKLDLEHINVNTFLEENVTLMRGEAEKRQLALTCEIEDTFLAIEADQRATNQVILNLLSNACKHTPAGGAIRITSTRISSRFVSISVVDNGSGIPQEAIDNLFKPYWSSGTMEDGVDRGYGLGLALTKMLIEAHGGTIEIRSTLGQGTMVTITLPAASSSASEAA